MDVSRSSTCSTSTILTLLVLLEQLSFSSLVGLSPHFVPDCAVHAVSANDNISAVGRSVGTEYGGLVFGLFNLADSLVQDYLALVLNMIGKYAQNPLTVEEASMVP